MIENKMKEEILKRLKKTEEKEGVRILMAVESGSRAWGFASPNSDYDVRFIYSRTKDWYLTLDLEDKRDVIEYPIMDEIDLNGWDIRKALRLYWKSNPGFVEWIQSPITYINCGSFREDAVNLLPCIYSVEKGIYHYLNMARSNYLRYLRGDIVPIKKYFYALRPLFSIKWMEKYGIAAPIEFDKVLESAEVPDLMHAIHDLLKKKKESEEKALAPAIPLLTKYIESELRRLEEIKPEKLDKKSGIDPLNELFIKIINEK